MAHAVGAPRLWARLTQREEAPPPTLEELLSSARWRRNVRNPELKKALGYVQATLGEIRRLLAQPEDELSLRTPQVLHRLRDALDQPVESLRIDSAWELYSEVKAMLPLLGNADYVASHLDHEAERVKDSSRWHPWTSHFSADELRRLRENYERVEPDRRLHAQAAAKLAFLYTRRAEAGRERRAKAAQKCRYLNVLAPALLGLQAALVLAIDAVADESGTWKPIVVAGTAGALGATLAGTMKIRDDLRGLDDLRSFWPAMRVQPLVGATAGLIVLLLLETGTLDGGNGASNWAGLALVAFAAGFSEPFFLGLVQKVAVIPDKGAGDAEKKEGARNAAGEPSAPKPNLPEPS
jgi:hypothetical protein